MKQASEPSYEQLYEDNLRALAATLADESGLPAAVWRTAYDIADDEDVFGRVVLTWRDTGQDPVELSKAFAADQARNPVPTLYSIGRLPTWQAREKAAREAIDLVKRPIAEYAKLRRQALAAGLQEHGSPAGVAKILGVSRQAISKALVDPKDT